MVVEKGLRRFLFQREKAIEMILYLAQRIDDPTVMKICKLMYFADKRHLDYWGKFLCGNDYVAMEHGPVPINVYEMLNHARSWSRENFEVGERSVKPLRLANMDLISEAAQQTLDWALREYGNFSSSKLREISHQEEAWQNAWDEESSNKRFDMPILSIAATLPDSESLIAHLQGNQ